MRSTILFLRSALLMIVMVLATVVWIWVCMLAAPFKYNTRYKVTACWNRFVVWAAEAICGIKYQWKGYDNFPDAPAIVLSKHQSAWETIFLLQATPRPLVYVFKREILWIPFFGWGMALLRMIPINRSEGRNAFQQVVQQGRRRLADGQWIIMFPEGTRIAVGKKGKYKSGGARLAVETNTPVVPIALNSGEVWPKNSFLKLPGTITVSVGKPISPENHTPDSLLQEVENWIESEMRVISPHVYKGG